MRKPILAGVVLALVQAGFSAPATAQSLDNANAVRGVIRAEIAATLSTELVAQISQLPFKTGQAFKTGELLLKFDCRSYEADLRGREAEVEVHKITLNQNRKLLRRRAAGANEVAIAAAKLAQAEAAADALRARLDRCAIAAPFDGRVGERMVQVHEMPQANAPLLKIVKNGDPEIDLIVPSRWVTWLKAGHKFTFRIDETQTSHKAEVLHLGAIVDPVSRTINVTARLRDATGTVRPGMSGSATFDAPKRSSWFGSFNKTATADPARGQASAEAAKKQAAAEAAKKRAAAEAAKKRAAAEAAKKRAAAEAAKKRAAAEAAKKRAAAEAAKKQAAVEAAKKRAAAEAAKKQAAVEAAKKRAAAVAAKKQAAAEAAKKRAAAEAAKKAVAIELPRKRVAIDPAANGAPVAPPQKRPAAKAPNTNARNATPEKRTSLVPPYGAASFVTPNG